MKLRRMLVFSAVIVSLTLVAIAARPELKEFTLKFKGDGNFILDEAKGCFVSSREEGDLLNVSHLGLSDVWYEIYPGGDPQDPPNFGPFTITGANGDMLKGYYSNFELGVGTYVLDWVFTEGTGRFEGATGTGHTDGLVDFETLYAEFEFSGTIYVPKGK